jgi:hypothetical protein
MPNRAFEYPPEVRDLLGLRADFILCNDRSKMSCVCQFRPDALCANTQEILLELLGVHEADRDSGLIEDAHHLARHVVRDDWALCAAAAE